MKFKKVLIVGFEETELNSDVWKRLDSLTEEKVFEKPDSSEISKNFDSDCLLVKFNKADKELLAKFKNLKYIGVLATGFNQVDIDFAIRGLGEGLRRGKAGNYSEAGIKAIEIQGKVFGVLGFG